MNKLGIAVVAISALAGTAFGQGTPPAGGPPQGGPPGGGPPPMAPLPAVQKGKAGPMGKYSKAQIKRGAELVRFGGCNTCHTPWSFNKDVGAPGPDMAHMLSGHPAGAPEASGTLGNGDMAIIGPTFTSFKFPWGMTYAANLTPDTDTGTGTWTEKMFVDIFRKGKHMGGNGRPVLPPMPWMDVASLSDADLKSIYAFLRTIPPIHNEVPENKVPPPVMEGMGHMNDGILNMMKHMPK
jgi:hypothetical protein